MDFQQMMNRARDIRHQYADFETTRYGRPWTDEEIALGLVGDVGDLVKLVQARNGIRTLDDVEDRLAHELADCLWSVIVLVQAYDVYLEAAFIETMDSLEAHLSQNTD